MIYEYDLTIPAATTKDSPVTQTMVLSKGIIHKLEVSFPFGCNNAVLVTIHRAAHQVWPTNRDGQLKANGWTISYPVWHELEEPPYQLEIYGWSPDTTYSHTISVRLGIEPRETLDPGYGERGILSRLGELILGRR